MTRITMTQRYTHAQNAPGQAPLLPLAAMLLAGSLSAPTLWAQEDHEKTLKTVTVKDTQESPTAAKESLRAQQSGIAKGQQALKDIPQTVTVMTEKLMNDRNLDDFREVLKTTAGVTFQAGETGEEDVRLRGFSLAQAGDIYVDGLRDAPLIERDTFNQDRVEVLKGSASMLFGKGSTGGVVNQVNKQPFLMDQHEITATVGTGNAKRVTGDFNWQTGEASAVRLNVMTQDADHSGAKADKTGVAGTYRWGIGERDEFSVGLYHLKTDGRPLYNHPWFLSNGTSGTISPSLPASNYYGLASDYLRTESTYATVSHKHRLDQDSAIKTTVRHGTYERDLWASAVRFANGTTASNLHSATEISRTPKGRYGKSDLTQVQSDFNGKFQALGLAHALMAGVDLSREDAARNNSFAGTASGLTTTVGTPNDGDWRSDTRGTPVLNTFKTDNIGLYVQDTLRLTSTLQLLAGVRFDKFKSTYITNACDPVQTIEVQDDLWSPRIALMFQPHEAASYYASMGTSYNTSGDTYGTSINACVANNSTNAKLINTPPEKSQNIEIGGKFELFENKASFGAALFHTTKFNERNTDSDSAATQMLLSGKRHATGLEFNFAGRMTPEWEVFYNHTWIPQARIDESNVALNVNGTGAQVKGDRPALTPKHSASLWTTYRLHPQWRVGSGLNYRSEQNPEGARHITAPAFTTLDAMAEYVASDQLTVKLNITNLTDKLYADSLYRGFYAPGAARRVELSLKTLF